MPLLTRQSQNMEIHMTTVVVHYKNSKMHVEIICKFSGGM